MKRIASLLSIILLLVIAGSTSVAAANTDYDYKVPHSSEANKASYWVTHFQNKGFVNVTCTKYGESHNGWLPGSYEAGIIKAGQWNYVWMAPGNQGQYLQAPQDLSHIFKCNFKQPPPPPEYDPNASYIVCGDPRLILTLDNDSDIAVRYTIEFKTGNSNVFPRRKSFTKVVAAHSEKTVIRWVKGQSWLKVTAVPTITLSIYSLPKVTVISERLIPAIGWGKGDCPASLRAAS